MPDFTNLLLPHQRRLLRLWFSEDDHVLLRLEFPRSGGSGLWFFATDFTQLEQCLAARPEKRVEAVFLKNGMPLRGNASGQFLKEAEKLVSNETDCWQIISPLTTAPSETEFLALGDGRDELREAIGALRGQPVAFGLDVMSNEAVYPEWALGREEVLYLGAFSHYSYSHLEVLQTKEGRLKGPRNDSSVLQALAETDHPWLKLLPAKHIDLVGEWIAETSEIFVGLGPSAGCLKQVVSFTVSSIEELLRALKKCRRSFTATILPKNPLIRLDSEGIEQLKHTDSKAQPESLYVAALLHKEPKTWKVIDTFSLESDPSALLQQAFDGELFVCRDEIGFMRRDLIPVRISEPELIVWRYFASDLGDFEEREFLGLPTIPGL